MEEDDGSVQPISNVWFHEIMRFAASIGSKKERNENVTTLQTIFFMHDIHVLADLVKER